MKNKGAILASLILSLGVVFSSCQISNSTQYAATYSGGTIPTGAYVLYCLQNAENEIMAGISQTDPELLQDGEDVYGINFNGKMIEDLIVERAKTEMQMYVGANKLFEELKLDLTEQQKDFLKQEENVYKEGEDTYKELGISKESVLAYAENAYKREILFNYYYGENGENRPKDEELKKYFADNYLKLSRRPFRYGFDENKEKTKEEAQKFLNSVKDNSFEEAWRIEEAEERIKALEEEKKAKGREAEKQQAEKTTEKDKIGEDEESSESAENESYETDANKKSEGEIEKEETPEETRDRIKNTNTVLANKSMLKSIFKQKELDKIDDADFGAPILVNSVSNKAFFVVVKQKTDGQEFENAKENVLHESCKTPFEKILVAKGKAMDIEFNETAISEFRPSKVQKKKNN